MKQPTKDALRDQLVLAANRIIELKTACGWWERESHAQADKYVDRLNRLTLEIQEMSLTRWQRIKRWLA